MIISVTNDIISVTVNFAGIECRLYDNSKDMFKKLSVFTKNFADAKCSEVVFDSVKGVASVYRAKDAFPLFTLRADKCFDSVCDLVRLYNLFATKKALIRIS